MSVLRRISELGMRLDQCDESRSHPCSSSSSCHPFSSESEESPGTSQILKTWPETFQVPWNLMPADIQSAIVEEKRASPGGRRRMVRIIADKMRKNELNPTRAQCAVVCRNIVRQYPKTFADQMSSGQIVGGGYDSLLLQIKNRIENINRPTSFRQHRSSNRKKRGPTDTYGCTRFQPALPPEETEETQETKRKQLLEIYAREGMNGGERADVKETMNVTFALQRLHINALPSPNIAELKTKWPYLFTSAHWRWHWKVSLEGSIVSDGIQPTFGTGLAAVFSTYYNFNLEYPDEAACTLEFIQRRFIGINPERGTKLTRGEVVTKKNGKVTVKKTSTVNPRVSTLLRL
ncbi:uncharacterized protein [Eucyclogobius newberryi]|uniref:uncharacterized protein n=1 Tax=Eucyclogobius newberryi TaxID=166745 RepID=UPI003B5AF672